MTHGPTVQPDVWTTRSLLSWIETHLAAKGIDEPLVTARWLVAHVLGTDPIHLYTDLERPASADEREALRALVLRAAASEPVQYMIGEAGFLGRLYDVTPDVLIPRTATESLVQIFDTWYRGIDPSDRDTSLWVADIGTGSGCVAISVALQHATVQVVATDCSSQALKVAAGNIERHGVTDRVSCVLGDCCQPLGEFGRVGRYHAIVSNPPYIDDAHWGELADNVRRFEPEGALRGGGDGLTVVRRIIDAAPGHLLPGGLLAIEVDDHHAAAGCKLLTQAGLHDARVIRDEHGDDRFVVACQGD